MHLIRKEQCTGIPSNRRRRQKSWLKISNHLLFSLFRRIVVNIHSRRSHPRWNVSSNSKIQVCHFCDKYGKQEEQRSRRIVCLALTFSSASLFRQHLVYLTRPFMAVMFDAVRYIAAETCSRGALRFTGIRSRDRGCADTVRAQRTVVSSLLLRPRPFRVIYSVAQLSAPKYSSSASTSDLCCFPCACAAAAASQTVCLQLFEFRVATLQAGDNANESLPSFSQIAHYRANITTISRNHNRCAVRNTDARDKKQTPL